jgi:acyl carrier protein
MKSENEIKVEVKNLIAEVIGIPSEEVSIEHKIEDLSDDSIQLFQLLVAFEKFYQTEASYEEVMKLETVGDIVSYVERVIYKI